jgi:uncharacterized membrane protein YiaA
MHGLIRHFTLTMEAKTGFSRQILVWLLVAVIGSTASLIFLTVAAFFWLVSLYGPVHAALIVAGFYFLVALVAVLCALAIRRRTSERAQLQLAARQSAGLLDPKLLTIGLQVGRAVGWHRLLTVAAAGALIAGLAKEFRHREAQDQTPAE